MVLDINDLWRLRNENAWVDALDRYWLNPTVCKKHDIERLMDKVDLSYVQRLDIQQWYEFLNKYFHWKFTGNDLRKRLIRLDKNSFGQLFSVKRSLLAIDALDLADSRKCLNLVKSPRIRGLDCAGASGLLAVMFEEWFGAVDQFVLESLCSIDSLPEKQRVGESRAWVKRNKEWKESDAVLVIDIMRRKAAQLNGWFCTNKWTPRKIAMILWISNRPVRNELLPVLNTHA